MNEKSIRKTFRVGTFKGGNPNFSAVPIFHQSRPPTPPTYRGVPGIVMKGTIGEDNFQSQYIKRLVLDLSVARTAVQFNLTGTIIWLYRVFNTVDGSPNTTAFLQIQIADINADPLTWYAGNGIEGIPFNKVIITNPAQAGIQCEMAYFRDSVDKPVRFF